MTFNYRSGLFRIWLLLSIFWVIGTAWLELPVGVVVGVPVALGVAVYAVVWAIKGFGLKQHAPKGFFDIDDLRLELASSQSGNPYMKEIEPLLDLLKAKYGRHVPIGEMGRLRQFIDRSRAQLKQEEKDIVAHAAAEGKTIDLEALRRRFEKMKAEYHGQDRDAFSKEMDQFVEGLAVKYGSQIPIDEMYLILQRLEANIENWTRDEPVLDWSREPGFQERRLLLRHNNVLFPRERRRVSEPELLSAKRLDEECSEILKVPQRQLSPPLVKAARNGRAFQSVLQGAFRMS